ncbi:hypothetical protein OG763_38095 [Streptomyces sp. NBC_01230]|uniref:RNA polymerase sigma factor n=1 Tax=Streptomyces phage Spernnie TaxID=2767588 RepID=A0A873WVL4_9CAUD|nr:RNA polymerase sigma factor [Streptomyces phage Spernnie]QPB09644.1 RNA polymerase sigma factor [Streptomyces phage Spernnie]WSQ31161.1 hypothetical protein OG763_38095 [Streptomyces sp. NBC_01230]
MIQLKELPGDPGPTLRDIYAAMNEDEQGALAPHILGETSADWLSTTLRRHGHDVSATTIRTYRRSLRQEGG